MAVNSLKVALAGISDAGLAVDVKTAADTLRPTDSPELRVGIVRLHGQLYPLDGEYLFRGALETDFTGVCDRCLAPVSMDVHADVVWTFVPGTGESDRDSSELEDVDSMEAVEADLSASFFTGTEINLGARVWEELVLAYPSKMLCAAACKGLCPQCGANLNAGPCGCAAETKTESAPTKKGLAALGDMFPDLKPGASKE
jgi:uncharacterized protein